MYIYVDNYIGIYTKGIDRHFGERCAFRKCLDVSDLVATYITNLSFSSPHQLLSFSQLLLSTHFFGASIPDVVNSIGDAGSTHPD